MILVGAALGVLSVLAGLLSRRLGAPVLLVFLVLGMLAGEDGPGGIQYDDFASAYLVGSVALAVILFEGGLKTHLSMLRLAVWPALALAVIGVGITAAIVAAAVMWIAAVPFAMAMLVGAAVAPTDAAAVAALLGRARLALPERINALLEVESGLNDPMSIFLTVFVIRVIVEPASATWLNGALLFAREMIGGAALGLGGGWLLGLLLRRLSLEVPTAMVLVLAFGLTLFGLAQVLGTSGFLAIYLAGVVVGATPHRARREIAQLRRGLRLAGADRAVPDARPAGHAARPGAVHPDRHRDRPGADRRGAAGRDVRVPAAVPFPLAPVGVRLLGRACAARCRSISASSPRSPIRIRDERLFSGVFVVVVVSLVIQGWTIGPAARLLGFGRAE